jgi:hypothetical protein
MLAQEPFIGEGHIPQDDAAIFSSAPGMFPSPDGQITVNGGTIPTIR